MKASTKNFGRTAHKAHLAAAVEAWFLLFVLVLCTYSTVSHRRRGRVGRRDRRRSRYMCTLVVPALLLRSFRVSRNQGQPHQAARTAAQKKEILQTGEILPRIGVSCRPSVSRAALVSFLPKRHARVSKLFRRHLKPSFT